MVASLSPGSASIKTLLVLLLVGAVFPAGRGQIIPVVAPAPQARGTAAPASGKASFGNRNAAVAASQALAEQLRTNPGTTPLPVQQAYFASTTNNATNLTGGAQSVRFTPIAIHAVTTLCT